MAYLFDTNVFLRLANTADPAHALARNALTALRRRHEILCFTPQVLVEFWSVCTRPASARGGFGLSPVAAERRVRVIERYFRLLPESVATYHEWRQLVVRHAVSGVQVYDARLVASMHVYGITHLLTFNAQDFIRYSHITVLEPQHVAQTS
jgi:predicted nucleic acid-binding protein